MRSRARLRRWLKGYGRKYRGERVRSAPRMVAAFVRHGVDLKVIRATVGAATQTFGTSYPLTNQKFLTDKKRIFLDAIEQATGKPRMIGVLKKQSVFADIIKPSLYAGIEYGSDGARRWYPEARRKVIVLYLSLQFGTPVVAKAGIPTDTIHTSYRAEGGDKAMVARVFNITPKMAAAAVMFEKRLAA